MAAPVAQSNVPSCSYDARVPPPRRASRTARDGRPPSTASPSEGRSVRPPSEGLLRRAVVGDESRHGDVHAGPEHGQERGDGARRQAEIRVEHEHRPGEPAGSDAGVEPRPRSPALETKGGPSCPGHEPGRSGLGFRRSTRCRRRSTRATPRPRAHRAREVERESGHRRGAVVGHHDDADGSGDVRRSHTSPGKRAAPRHPTTVICTESSPRKRTTSTDRVQTRLR